MARHESQAAVIAKLHKLIATIEALPEETSLFQAEAWLNGENEIFLDKGSFAAMFASQEVTSQGTTAFKIVNGCRFKGGIATLPEGPLVMPALETVKGGA